MTLRRGFEIYYFDGQGHKPVGPLDFETFMGILGELDAVDGPVVGEDDQLSFDLLPTTEEDLPNRQSKEPSGPGDSQEIKEGF